MVLGVPFDEAGFLSGVLTAMGVGTPPALADQPLFVFADTTTVAVPTDSEGVPFDPAARPTVTPGARVRVPCAVEYLDNHGQVVNFGIVTPSTLRLTLLDAQYRQIKGFSHVVIGGDRYNYRRTAPPEGMVTATVWTIYAVAEDET